MKRAYLVLGPESAGTRLMTRLLIAAGCFGDDGHDQRLDKDLELDSIIDCDLAWRRSFPYGVDHEWPDLPAIRERIHKAGYLATALVMSRDWHAMAISQQYTHTDGDIELALLNIKRAYREIFAGLGDTPYELVNYEALTQRPATVDYLFPRIGLPSPAGVYIYDGNTRYYYEKEPAQETALFQITAVPI